MDTIRKILVPIDFSNHSTRVLQLAADPWRSIQPYRVCSVIVFA